MNRLLRHLLWRWDCLIGDLRGNPDYPGCCGCGRARFQHIGLWPDTRTPLDAWCDRCFHRSGRLPLGPHVSFLTPIVGATEAEADRLCAELAADGQIRGLG